MQAQRENEAPTPQPPAPGRLRATAAALSSTLARYTAPATVCGAPCRRVLCLGDGDLSCSAALAEAGVDVTATTLDTRDDLHRKYGAEAAARFDRLGAVGGVDATAPGDLGEAFDRVIFNFPHAPGKQNIRRNRELLHAVCAGAPHRAGRRAPRRARRRPGRLCAVWKSIRESGPRVDGVGA